MDQGLKIEMVSADDMTDTERRAVFDRPMTKDAIPDLDILTGHVFEILEYLYKDSTEKLLKTNESAVKMFLNNKYADTVPYGVITLLIEKNDREKNVEGLLELFKNLAIAKKGEIDLETIEKNLSESVNQRYLYDQYGSKEAFEKEIMKQNMKQQHENRLNGMKNVQRGQIKLQK